MSPAVTAGFLAERLSDHASLYPTIIIIIIITPITCCQLYIYTSISVFIHVIFHPGVSTIRPNTIPNPNPGFFTRV